MQETVELQTILEFIDEMQQDSTVPKNLKAKLETLNSILKSDDGEAISIKMHKAIHALADVAEDVNIEPYTRTQVWNLVSLMEGVQ